MTESFASIPAGRILMGSDEGQADEQPVHPVRVNAFLFGVHPVTNDAYARFLAATGHELPREWAAMSGNGGDRPVVGVSWHDAQAYCVWLGEVSGGVAFRLPTEAEWEHAARGGVEGERYPWGMEIPDWIPDGGRGPLDAPWPVTRGTPNRFGLYGIAANIHEWCEDWHAADYYGRSPLVNPTGPEAGRRRASRGGSWRHAVTISRTAARSRIDPAFRYTDYGFRVAAP